MCRENRCVVKTERLRAWFFFLFSFLFLTDNPWQAKCFLKMSSLYLSDQKMSQCAWILLQFLGWQQNAPNYHHFFFKTIKPRWVWMIRFVSVTGFVEDVCCMFRAKSAYRGEEQPLSIWPLTSASVLLSQASCVFQIGDGCTDNDIGFRFPFQPWNLMPSRVPLSSLWPGMLLQ